MSINLKMTLTDEDDPRKVLVIDLELLKRQKEWLVRIVSRTSEEGGLDHAQGLLAFLDGFQDYLTDNLRIPEDRVFDL